MIAGFLNHQQYLKHLKHFPLSPSPPLFAGDRSVLPHSSCHTKTIHSMPPTWKTHRAPGPGGLSIIRWVAVLGPQNSSKRFQRIHPNTFRILYIYIYVCNIYIYSNLPHATNVWQTLEILENCSFSSRCVAVLHCISGISEDGKTRETVNQNPAKVSEIVNNKVRRSQSTCIYHDSTPHSNHPPQQTPEISGASALTIHWRKVDSLPTHNDMDPKNDGPWKPAFAELFFFGDI